MQLLAIEHPWTRTFMKLFSTFDTNTKKNAREASIFLRRVGGVRRLNMNCEISHCSMIYPQLIYRVMENSRTLGNLVKSSGTKLSLEL